ncbi:MAG TPA: hypothetical protein DHW54_01975 [Gemmatimonadetes bacterium]|nr:hypothetical protein [Gemmatimonadota bacterium]|tara:strand:+ start:3754 stop:4788 length:1035 start_codon:yes stop_codon:yes gene_type:complete
MLKVDRTKRILKRLDEPSLTEAQILERADLQEYIYNSSNDFFTEIGERVFIIGEEVTPSQTVQDRIDLLGIDSEGASVVVELKRGSNKLQMLQAVSYAGMVARWGLEDFRSLVSADLWEELTDFLDVDVEELNRRQRLLLVAEGYDYTLLTGAEWLNEQYGVDIRCFTVNLATDQTTGAEYLACTSVFPPPALADQAAARHRARRDHGPLKWGDWNEVLATIENEALRNFAREEIDAGRENYLRKRGIHFRLDGKSRWTLHCRIKHAYVWQRGRFLDDLSFWKTRLSDSDAVKPVKAGRALALKLLTQSDFDAFRKSVTVDAEHKAWSETGAFVNTADNEAETE